MKSMIIGLDGATFDLIGPWVEEGYLPTFERIMEEGSYGNLMSTVPPTTIPAWISLGTGKNPGRFGLYYMFHLTEERELKPTPPILKDYGFFWSKIARKEKVGLLNIPFIRTELKNGFCVPGRGTIDPYPRDMRSKLPAWTGARPDWRKGEKYNLEILNQMVENQAKNTKYVLKNWDLDFLFSFFVATDTIQHQFWGYMDEDHPLYKDSKYKDAILNLYRKIDGKIDEILSLIDDEVNLFILSDHGFQPYRYSISINHWLKENGFLQLKEGKKDESSLLKFLKRGHEKLQGTRLEKLIPSEVKSRAIDNFFPRIDRVIDWEKSEAYAATDGGGIYTEDNETKEEISEKIKDLENPYTGEPVVREVLRSEEIYSGERTKSAPELMVIPRRGMWITCRLGYPSTVIKRPSIISGSGTHSREGIFMARGPDIISGKKFDSNITDIAPTISRIFGLEEGDVDGNVLEVIVD